MRHRATGIVRMLARCARCNQVPDLYDVRRVSFAIGARRYELVVCKSCDTHMATEPTYLERLAMAVDLTDPIARMRFIQDYAADPERIVRSAEHILGVAPFAAAKIAVLREVELERARSARFEVTPAGAGALDHDYDDDAKDWCRGCGQTYDVCTCDDEGR